MKKIIQVKCNVKENNEFPYLQTGDFVETQFEYMEPQIGVVIRENNLVLYRDGFDYLDELFRVTINKKFYNESRIIKVYRGDTLRAFDLVDDKYLIWQERK